MQAIKDVGKKYAPITDENKQEFVERLQNFIQVRVDYILRFPGLSVPLKQLVEQFQMSNKQIKTLTMHRMQHSDITFNIETTQSNLMKGQSCDIFNQIVKKMVSFLSLTRICI